MSDDDNDGYSSPSDFDSQFDDGEDEVQDHSDYESTRKATAKKGRRGRKPKNNAADYTIKNALKAPRATTYTAQALFEQIVNGDIDLDPEYQRDVVWPELKQVGLIDSVFRNFYIPPVIFSVNFSEDGSESRTCIDGKQRLTSIYRFMLGLIPHRDRMTNDKYWYKDTGSGDRKRRKILPEKYRRLFANKQIVCVEYGEIGDKDEREIFQRVQLGMALTPAEKLGVVKSPRADFVRDIQSSFFKDDSSSLLSLAWDSSRGTDFRCLATILWCIDRYHTSSASLVNPGSIVQLESFLNNQAPLSSAVKTSVKNAFQTFQEMVSSDNEAISGPFRMSGSDFTGSKKAVAKKAISPLEFICIYLLIYVWRDKMSQFAMAAAIRAMRQAVRREYVDVRLNTRVGGSMISFLKAIKPEEYEKSVGNPGKATTTSSQKIVTDSPKTGTKRKRAQDDDAASTSDVSMLDASSSSTTTTTLKPGTKSSKTNQDASPSTSTPPTSFATPGKKSMGSLAALRRLTMDHQNQVQDRSQSRPN